MGTVIHRDDIRAVRAHKPPYDRDIKVLASPFCARASNAFAVGVTFIEPGKVHEVHTHEVEEVAYILQGTGICECCGEKIAFRPGMVIQAAPNEPHGFTNDGENCVEILWVTAPAGREKAFIFEID